MDIRPTFTTLRTGCEWTALWVKRSPYSCHITTAEVDNRHDNDTLNVHLLLRLLPLLLRRYLSVHVDEPSKGVRESRVALLLLFIP